MLNGKIAHLLIRRISNRRFDMNKTGIEWCDYTWNPITGCLHKKNVCPIADKCYANRDAKRIYECDKEKWAMYKTFDPYFHKDRLNDPGLKARKQRKIFVGSMGDMWGGWVPWFQQHAIIEVIGDLDYTHIFQFLTKNPQGYINYYLHEDLNARKGIVPFDAIPKNCWLGFTDTHDCADLEKIRLLRETFPEHIIFVSLEPFTGWRKEIIDLVDWVIIGGWSKGTGKLTKQNNQGITELLIYCMDNKKPFFLKDNTFQSGLNVHPCQQFPEAL